MSDGRLPADEVTLTIRPQPRSAIAGANARISRIEAITCRSHWRLPVLLGELVEPAREARARVVDEDVRRRAAERFGDPLGGVERRHVDALRARHREHARALRLEQAARSPRRCRGSRRSRPRCGRSVPGPSVHDAGMTAHTVYRTFNTDRRREFVRITDDVEEAVSDSGIREGMALVCAMHITAGVWINDDEPGHPRGHARVARQAGAAVVEGARQRGRARPRPRPRRLPPPPRRRGQRRRALEEPARPPPGGGPGHRRQARPRPVAGDLLRRVRRRPRQAARHQGAGRVGRRGVAGFRE